MKTEYQTLVDSIKSLVEREDDKGQDTFDMSIDYKGVFTDGDDTYRNTSILRWS